MAGGLEGLNDAELMQLQASMPQTRSSPYASPMHNFSGSILLLTNPENELYKLELSLRNMVVDKEGNPKQAGLPLLNDEGVASVIGQVQGIVSQVTVMSNLEQREIDALRDFLGDTIARDLMVSRIRYGVTWPNDRDRIYFLAISEAVICMKRAAEEGERRFWKGSQQEITTTIQGGGSMGKRKGGFLGQMLGWK